MLVVVWTIVIIVILLTIIFLDYKFSSRLFLKELYSISDNKLRQTEWEEEGEKQCLQDVNTIEVLTMLQRMPLKQT